MFHHPSDAHSVINPLGEAPNVTGRLAPATMRRLIVNFSEAGIVLGQVRVAPAL